MEQQFDPNACAPDNGNFVGLPFDEKTANIIFFPVPWEVTVSYSAGTARGPENIRGASNQLDLYDTDLPDAWKVGIYMPPSDATILAQSDSLREKTEAYIDALEGGEDTSHFAPMLAEVNEACDQLRAWVKAQTSSYLKQGKLVALVGGDHSTPLGYIEALAEQHAEFGILHLDAHLDLRDAYEGFTYSHASIFYNVLKRVPQVRKLVSVGIRDYCQAEVELIEGAKGRVSVFYDHDMKTRQYEGDSFKQIVDDILAQLPQQVYISFDIDGLDPALCPGTGTPVAGGLAFNQAIYLVQQLIQSGRTIIGFDLNEVGISSEWDGNVAARLLYKIANLMWKSNKS